MMNRWMRRLAALCMAAACLGAAQAAPAPYPNPGTEAPGTAFTAGTDGVLVGYYTGEAGGFTNLAGALINGVEGAIGLSNKTSAYGTRFVFGNVHVDDVLVFFIDVLDTGERFFSDEAMNADGVNHTYTDVYTGDALVPAGFNLAFEDIFGGGDFNYRDHSWVIRVEAAVVPLAPTALLLALGLAFMPLAGRVRRPR